MKSTCDRLFRAALLGAALLLPPAAASVAQAQDGDASYVRMRLGRGVEVDIPQAWHATTDQTGTPEGIHDSKLRAHLRAGTVSLVNAWTGLSGSEVDASTGIQSSTPPAWTPQRVSRLKPAEVGTLGNVMQRQLTADL